MSREVIIKILDDEELKPQFSQDGNVYKATFPNPYENMGELVRCKDCKHRPKIDGEYENGFDLEFPTSKCPCQCDDGYYNWMPNNDWYCANGERKEI